MNNRLFTTILVVGLLASIVVFGVFSLNLNNAVQQRDREITEYQNTVSVLELKIATLQSNVSSLEDMKSELEKSVITLILEKEGLQHQISNLTNQQTNLLHQVSVLTAENTVLQERVVDTSYRISELTENMTKLQEELVSLQANCTVMANSYVLLEADFLKLQANYTASLSRYENISAKYQNLVANYTELSSLYNILGEEYQGLLEGGNLTAQYELLQNRYADLQLQYAASSKQNEMLNTLHIGTTLETYNIYLREYDIDSIVDYPIDEEDPRYYNLSVIAAANMAGHDAGQVYWPDSETVSGYYEITGEYSYQTTYRILESLLHYGNISISDPDVVKIDKIMKTVAGFVTYQTRLVDHMWFPTETLTFRSGDCTAYSILESALFEIVGIKSAVAFFIDGDEAHAMVLVHLDNLGPYNYLYYPNLTSYGLTQGRWIVIEPQFTSLNQQSNSQVGLFKWMDGLKAVAEVPYGA